MKGEHQRSAYHCLLCHEKQLWLFAAQVLLISNIAKVECPACKVEHGLEVFYGSCGTECLLVYTLKYLQRLSYWRKSMHCLCFLCRQRWAFISHEVWDTSTGCAGGLPTRCLLEACANYLWWGKNPQLPIFCLLKTWFLWHNSSRLANQLLMVWSCSTLNSLI